MLERFFRFFSANHCRVAADGIVDGQLQSSIVKMQRCTLNGCGKVRHYLVICVLMLRGHLLCKCVKQPLLGLTVYDTILCI